MHTGAVLRGLHHGSVVRLARRSGVADAGRQHAIEAFRGWAGIIGLDATHECFIKGRCARIGGTSDVRSYCVQKWGPNGGIDQGIKLLDERGRWFTDISWIYARAGPEAQLTLSALMGDMDGGDLEALVSGWTQPGRRWGRAGR